MRTDADATIRYRVRFENGVELGTLDAKYLAPRKP
jgi:hypothetical protein